MKKCILGICVAIGLLAGNVEAQQAQKNFQIGSYRVIQLDEFSGALSPAIEFSIGGPIIGFSISFYGEGPATVTTSIEFGYWRDSVYNIIYKETGTATTFSWETNITGSWIIKPGDEFVVTSSDTETAQVTIILGEN